MVKLMDVGDVGKAWGSMFIENKTLVHLDLSQNRISQFETEQMAEDIIGNQTLVGFHYLGNHDAGSLGWGEEEGIHTGKVDSMGFINMQEAARNDAND
jgi:hypothetical protein